jgi:hypothetical protein
LRIEMDMDRTRAEAADTPASALADGTRLSRAKQSKPACAVVFPTTAGVNCNVLFLSSRRRRMDGWVQENKTNNMISNLASLSRQHCTRFAVCH